MYPIVCIKRIIPLVLAVLFILGWVIYFRSPSNHTKPVLSLTPLIHLTHSLKYVYMEEEVSFGSSVENEDNRADTLWNDNNTFYGPQTGVEINKLLEYVNTAELNNGTSIENVENSEYTSIWKDSNRTYQPQNKNEPTKLLSIDKENNNNSDIEPKKTLLNGIMMNSLQEETNESLIYSSSTETYTYDRLNFTSTWSQVLEHRQQRVVELCRKHPRQLQRIWGFGNLLYDTKHHLAYCRTAKAGTTWWLGSLLLWSGMSTIDLSPDAIHQAANQMFPPLDAQHLKEQLDAISFIFMAVRHPFTRLVSAYRDKVLNGYRKDLYSEMINSYRTNDTEDYKSGLFGSTTNTVDVPTFREFILFAAHQVNHCAMVPNSACMLEVDVHWRPAHDRCAPCNVHYDAIIKLETFGSDERYIKLITGMPSNKNNENGSAQNSQSSKTGHTTEDLTKDYFSSLSAEEVSTVEQAYYYDFLLFGYDPHQYY